VAAAAVLPEVEEEEIAQEAVVVVLGAQVAE
jgi:hypothetical protein